MLEVRTCVGVFYPIFKCIIYSESDLDLVCACTKKYVDAADLEVVGGYIPLEYIFCFMVFG